MGGVLFSLWAFLTIILVIKSQGNLIGMGISFQSPGFVSGMMLLFFLVALNLSGVFEVGQSLTKLGGLQQKTYTYASSFWNGMLMMLVATPCMAPFLGVSAGYALTTDSKTHAFMTFTAIGVGLGFPYAFFLASPRALKWLPKPGGWMEYFKQVMAFPIYATVVWLVSVLATQVTPKVLYNHLYSLVGIGWGRGFMERGSNPKNQNGKND